MMISNKKRIIQSTRQKVEGIRQISKSAYVLRFDRGTIEFEPGQHLKVGREQGDSLREYSIYSSCTDTALEILVKEISDGTVSPALRQCAPGDMVQVHGPYGCFRTTPEARQSEAFTFIATGTGVAPFHSLITSYPTMNYRLLHGVSCSSELYGSEDFNENRYTSCVSRDNGGEFRGRVTDYLRTYPVDRKQLYYLCGNSDMIYDVFEILAENDVPKDNIYTEVYF